MTALTHEEKTAAALLAAATECGWVPTSAQIEAAVRGMDIPTWGLLRALGLADPDSDIDDPREYEMERRLSAAYDAARAAL